MAYAKWPRSLTQKQRLAHVGLVLFSLMTLVGVYWVLTNPSIFSYVYLICGFGLLTIGFSSFKGQKKKGV